MLPKFARLFLFAAVLASAHAHGAPEVASNEHEAPGSFARTCGGLP
jgi:hypothetical protein